MSEEFCRETQILLPWCVCESCTKDTSVCIGGDSCDCVQCLSAPDTEPSVERLPDSDPPPAMPEICHETYYGTPCQCPRPHRLKGSRA